MSDILELIRRARQSGLDTRIAEPVAELPDVSTLLDMPMDPQLAALYRATNGCVIENLFVFGVRDVRYELIATNQFARQIRPEVAMLTNVLLCASFGHEATDLALVPVHADEQGCHPVVIVDTNEEAYIMPLASTLNRGLALLVDDEILFARDQGRVEPPFPDNAVEKIRQDTRLMQLIEADAFASIGGDRTLTQEWYDMLAEPNRVSS